MWQVLRLGCKKAGSGNNPGKNAKNGSPRAEFFTDEARRATRVRIPIHPAFLKNVEESSYTKEISDIIEVKATKKLSTKTRGQYISIFNYMDDKNWHKTSEIVNLLGIKETRAKELLKELISMEVLEDNGKTKGKMYRLK